MVYPGKRSTGCMRCRKRKVKCDEGRPTCERCKKYGRECPGYDNRLIIRFENQHRSPNTIPDSGRNQNRLPDGGHSALDDAGLSPALSSPAASSAATSTWSLEPPWEDVAVAHFFDQHVIEPRLGSLGHLEFLPGLYHNSPADSCLRTSLNAVANLSLYYSSKSPPLQINARRLHHEALLSMNSTLQNPDESSLDDTLAAAMLLSLFEDIDGARPGVSNSHISGMVSLIQLREKIGPPADPNRSLYGWAYTQIVSLEYFQREASKANKRVALPFHHRSIHTPKRQVGSALRNSRRRLSYPALWHELTHGAVLLRGQRYLRRN
ncbi:C6 transcription factor [Ilyonectria robusta]